MFCKHIKYNNNGNEIAKGPQCRYAKEFRFHIRGTDNTGAYKQCHYPQTITIKMFGLDGEKVLELAKEQLAVRYPEELQSIIEVISSHRPD